MRAALLLLLVLPWACGRPHRPPVTAPYRSSAAPPRPAGCVEVPPGASIQQALDGAGEGAALCLSAGVYAGPVQLSRGQTLWGPREAVIRSGGADTTVRLTGAGARLLGVTVDGSGHRYDLMDAGIKVVGKDMLVQGVKVVRAVYGILVDRSQRVTLRGNQVLGTAEVAMGLRGDAIRFFEVSDSVIEDNRVDTGRDVVIRYSNRSRISGNVISGCRYGMHLMYSHDNVLEHNRSIGNVVGTFIMYSRNVRLRDNLLAASAGAAGIGLGAKESGNLTVEDNLLVANTVGIYLDTTPQHVDDSNRFLHNAVRLSDVGVIFHSSQRRNTFTGNSFRDNHVQVRVEGGGDALGVAWQGNDWDDYAGYDLDGDGAGDVPYELRSLSGQLTARFPDLLYFRGTPALGLLDAVSHILPLFQPATVLRDPRPSMAEIRVEGPDGH